MRNTFGNALCVTLFGESHGESIGVTLDGLPSGLAVNIDAIKEKLLRRRPCAVGVTSRKEADAFRIISGVLHGETTGAPLTLLMENTDVHSADYDELTHVFRPSHADYPAYVKYQSKNDARGGGHFSGRLTAPLVAVSVILQEALVKKNIFVTSHILQIGSAHDRRFDDISSDRAILAKKTLAVLTDDAQSNMTSQIENAVRNHDSLGGVVETAVTGLPVGLGEPFFDGVESVISHAVFAIPAVKGISFGDGFSLCDKCGSETNDALCLENGIITHTSNHMGGIDGGLTNGMPILFHTAIKPTPSIGKAQHTVDASTMQNTTLSLSGRHDACVALRAPIVIDAMTTLSVTDLLLMQYGRGCFA